MKKTKITDRVHLLENGVYHYDYKLISMSKEEVDKLNEDYYKKQEESIKVALKDGYIEFPMLYDDNENPEWGSFYLPPTFEPSCSEGFEEKYGMKYNIYIPSYKRAGIALTNKTLDHFGITNYYFLVDPDQYESYRDAYGPEKVIIREPKLASDAWATLGHSAPAADYMRATVGSFNSCLFLAKSLGEDGYMCMDDDIFSLGIKARKGTEKAGPDEKYDKDNYYRASNLTNELYDFKSALGDMMNFYEKVRNRGMMSCEKYGIVFIQPIKILMNTRSYSFYLNSTKNGLRHLGRQNSDIISSLEYSKYGFVNMIQEGFPQYNTVDTQALAGGTTDVYTTFGTLDKGKVLLNLQPDVSKISYQYSRIHHNVDFSKFREMRWVGEVIKETEKGDSNE